MKDLEIILDLEWTLSSGTGVFAEKKKGKQREKAGHVKTEEEKGVMHPQAKE